MISEQLARKIADEAIRASKADETLVLLAGGKSALTRFATNHIHQNVLQKDYFVQVVTAFGKNVGVASSNLFDRGELERIVDVASTVAQRQKEDPLWEPLSGPFRYELPTRVYDEDTMAKAPEAKAEAVRAIIDPCKAAGCTAAGAYTNGDQVVAVANSHGLFAYHAFTSAELTLTVMTPEGSSGWAEGYGNSLEQVDTKALTARALEKAMLARNPVSLEPGKYDVILEPSAAATLLRYLSIVGFGGLAYNEGRSFVSGKLGERLMGENVTIRDDYMAGGVKGLPFDYEGHPRATVTLIERGVAKAVVHSRRTSGAAKTENTGHALPYPSTYGPIPMNLVLEPGTISRDEQISRVKRGLLITRSWYESIVDPKTPSLTGMTRDGTYLIEDGKVVGAVKNLRYNEDLRDLFSRVESLSSETETTSDWGATVTTPALHVRDFNVTGSTK